MEALAAIDADAPVRRLGFDVETISFINGKGRPLGRIPMAAPRADGKLSQMMRRTDLYGTLADMARQRGADVHHGKLSTQAVTTRQPSAGQVRRRNHRRR